MKRRAFIRNGALSTLLPAGDFWNHKHSEVLISEVKLYEVKVNQRGNWYFLELITNSGLTGLGECSHAHPISNPEGRKEVIEAITQLFRSLKGQSIYCINTFRQTISPTWNKVYQTVFSAFDQCLWDLCGKTSGQPVYNLLGGKLHEKVEVYANINRASNQRDVNGRRTIHSFAANAEKAMKAGFNAVKLAPFDEMKPLAQANPQDIEATLSYVLSCLQAVREVIGPDRKLLIDVHSHLNLKLARQFVERAAEFNLFWVEEPFDPQQCIEETVTLRNEIKPILAGGEAVFGLTGFSAIFKGASLDTVMPDVKHCGGISGLNQIASTAAALGVQVAPHNPSGPIATAATLAVCATMPSFQLLEYAYGEVNWSKQLTNPAEQFNNGFLQVSNKPGIGIELHYNELKKHLV